MKTVLILNVAALVTAAATAAVLAWANRASSNVVLAAGALLGAMALYGTQLVFELRRTVKHDHISAEFTIDRADRVIRQWAYPDRAVGWRPAVEINLGRSLAAVSPSPFDGDRDALTKDFMIRSLIAFLGYTEFDWQLNKTVFRGRSSGTVILLSPVSTEKDATLVTRDALQAELKDSGNLFANAPVSLAGGYLRLPPKSVLQIRRDFVVIRNPVLEIRFTAELSGSISYMKPGTGGKVENLASGEARYETRWVGLRVQRTFFALRARDASAARYSEWSDRLLTNLRDWFEMPEE